MITLQLVATAVKFVGGTGRFCRPIARRESHRSEEAPCRPHAAGTRDAGVICERTCVCFVVGEWEGRASHSPI